MTAMTSEETPPPTREAPKKLGRYELVAKLGTGSMGVVYKAKDPTIGRFVALKTINFNLPLSESEEADFRARFFREAQAVGSLVHPNIIQIYDIGEDAEAKTSFIAMEFAPGANLRDFMANDQLLPIEKVCSIMKQLARALDYAHARNVIHRDIKPANLILTTSDELKIADFGIAKIPQSSLTQTGKLLGTPYYMAPEQILGGDFDHRVDLFAAGVIFYQLLTGHLPFTGASMAAVAYKVVNEDPPPIEKYRHDVPRVLEKIVMKALAKKPQNRYARGKEMADAIAAFETEEREAAKKATWLVALGKTHERLAAVPWTRWGITAGAFLGVTAIVAAVMWWKPSDSIPTQGASVAETESAHESDTPAPTEDVAPAAAPSSTRQDSRERTTKVTSNPPSPMAEDKVEPPPVVAARNVEVALGLSHKFSEGTMAVRDAHGREMLRSEFTRKKVKVTKRVARVFKRDYDWEGVLSVPEGEQELRIEVQATDGNKVFAQSCVVRHMFSAESAAEISVAARWHRGEAILECEASAVREKK